VLILAIETSCDETAAAIARGPTERGAEVLSSVVASQDALHAPFGGIVPEIASRRHLETIVPVIAEAMSRASVGWDDLEGIAVTNGPGLIGSLVVGVAVAKAIAEAQSLPIAGIHHLEGHIYGAAVEQTISFPALALIASGGHSHLVIMRDHGRYQVIGKTRDDAAGEAFEKGARLLGLPYPGSPQLADLADSYRGRIRPMPRARIADSWDFSFSGVKTELARRVRQAPPADEERANLAAAYQESIDLALAERATGAAEEFGGLPILLVGGVARNRRLREMIAEKAAALGLSVRVPDPQLCTDNAAMVAAAGLYKLTIAGPDGPSLDVSANLALRDWRPIGGAAS